MMKIVVPQRVETVSMFLVRTNDSTFLRLVFTHDVDLSSSAGSARCGGDLLQDVSGRAVENLLRRVEAQSVEVKLLDPIPNVREKKFSHGRGVLSVEIERISPLALILGGE